MKNLQKSRVIIFILGLVLIFSAFAVGVLSPDTFDSLESSTESTLPEGVHIPININTADEETLCLLAGIGEKTAEKIIIYRSENGGFETVEEIMNVEDIGEKTFEKIKNYITV